MLRNLGMVIAYFKNLHHIEDHALHRAEFVLIEPEHKKELIDFIDTRGLPFSAHCPIFSPPDHPGKNALLTSLADPDPDRRAASVKLMKETVETAADLGAEYVVAHIQRPENFGGDNPSGFTPEKAVDSAKKSLDELLRFADRVEMPVLIENIFRNKSFFSADHYLSLLNEFPRCGFCLDVGHLDVDAHELDFSFDDFLDSLLPWIKAVHLQNSNSGNPAAGARPWKVPVHPSQSPRDGWHDIASMLEKILSANPNCVINFESRINIPEEEEMLREGIEWVKELIPRITPKTSVLSD